MKELIRTAICYILMVAFIGYFMVYKAFIEERITEVEARYYVEAKEQYSNHIATKELYCKFLEDHFLSEWEDYQLMKISNAYNRKKRNEKAKEAAAKIKSEGCK